MTEQDNSVRQSPQLVGIELRVLGVLMEKQLTTPDQYPLTVNGIINGCNQKSNREPVTNYTQGEIVRTLQELQHKRLVNNEYGSRAEKYTQQFIKHLELGKKHQAVLCVMMLRGPQTLSELNTRTQRMVEFTDKEDLAHILDRLCNREVPYVCRLSQRPGQRGERFMHLFSGIPDQSIPSGSNASALSTATTASGSDRIADASSPVNASADPNTENVEIELLKTKIRKLTEESRQLKQQISRLYQLTGHEIDTAVGE